MKAEMQQRGLHGSPGDAQHRPVDARRRAPHHEGSVWKDKKMPLAGKGMLLTSMNIDAADEADFKNMLRVVARITISNGTGRGAALGLVRLRPTPDNAGAWRDALQEKLTPETREGIISMHLLESEPELSGATANIPAARNEGARDWFVLIDGTHVGAVSAVIAERFTGPAAAPFPLPVSIGTYALMW